MKGCRKKKEAILLVKKIPYTGNQTFRYMHLIKSHLFNNVFVLFLWHIDLRYK